ncbi:response regulator [Puniceicoccaceae bacterium K14]|nr:response regulator [Puniceicoccaceae bacterium K14]
MNDKKKIVVLEDDRSSARVLTAFLEKKGFEVLSTSEGRFAIELTLREKPDLLIADIMLPDMNGSEMVKQLKKSAAGKDLNVLFLTSLLSKVAKPGEETKLRLDGIEFPALSKPFQPESLFTVVSRLTAGNN